MTPRHATDRVPRQAAASGSGGREPESLDSAAGDRTWSNVKLGSGRSQNRTFGSQNRTWPDGAADGLFLAIIAAHGGRYEHWGLIDTTGLPAALPLRVSAKPASMLWHMRSLRCLLRRVAKCLIE